jgi:hypothetical protein
VYNAEGVNVPATSFKDNKPTLLLLEDKAAGVFAMIDEEMNVPRGSDDTYLSKVKTKHGKHENFCVPKVDPHCSYRPGCIFHEQPLGLPTQKSVILMNLLYFV